MFSFTLVSVGLGRAELDTRIDADHAFCEPNKLQNISSAF